MVLCSKKSWLLHGSKPRWWVPIKVMVTLCQLQICFTRGLKKVHLNGFLRKPFKKTFLSNVLDQGIFDKH